MSHFVKLLIFISFSAFLITGCTKDYSFEGGPLTTANYTFIKNGDSCSAYVVSGNYTVSTPLNTGNRVQVQVNVADTGAYSINTNGNNGMVFSASGNFTTTGNQTIVLSGSGTPSADGIFTFSATGNPSCSFTVSVTPAGVTKSVYSFVGANSNCAGAILSGNYIAGIALTAENTVELKVTVTTPGAFSIKTDTLDGISFSASGTFASTGSQAIVLKGSGTPADSRDLIFMPNSGTSSCSFSLSVLTNGPLATYVLESGTGTNGTTQCNFVVAGDYVANTALTNADSVTIRAYITIPGGYTISTGTSGGMVFSSTGVFTTTGSQNVALKGTGKPTASGDYTFTPSIIGPAPLGGAACSFTITVK